MNHLSLPLIGKRITVRAAVVEDLEDWYQLESDKDVKRYVGGPVTQSRDDWISGMRRAIDRGGLLSHVVAVKPTGTFAGRARLTQYDACSLDWEIQVLIAKSYWGERLGRDTSEILIRAGFDFLPAAGIVAVIHPENEPSLKLFETLGFKDTGKRPADGWDEGHLIYRLRPEHF
jgi:[ribosomal protein S5]-alanine N-acetyltransferase